MRRVKGMLAQHESRPPSSVTHPFEIPLTAAAYFGRQRNHIQHGQPQLNPDGSLQILKLCHEALGRLFAP
jgi:hypothetical protein